MRINVDKQWLNAHNCLCGILWDFVCFCGLGLMPLFPMPMSTCLWVGSFESITFWHRLEQNLITFESFLASWVVYAQRGLKIPSWLLQDGLLELMWTQHGPKLAPSWLKLVPCWPQVGSNLAQVGSMLDPDPRPQLPLSQPRPIQIPPLLPLDLPNLYLCLTRIDIDPEKALKPPT